MLKTSNLKDKGRKKEAHGYFFEDMNRRRQTSKEENVTPQNKRHRNKAQKHQKMRKKSPTGTYQTKCGMLYES